MHLSAVAKWASAVHSQALQQRKVVDSGWFNTLFADKAVAAAGRQHQSMLYAALRWCILLLFLLFDGRLCGDSHLSRSMCVHG